MAKSFKSYLKDQKKPVETTRFVGLKMPVSLYKKIETLSKDNNCSISEVIFQMIQFSLNSDKNG